MSTSNDPSVKRRPRWRRALVISAQLLLGLGLGAAIAEYAFDLRDDGAFPHVNFYVADPELGVRLEPGASMRFQLRQNPVATIHVNQLGYRGGDWPAPSAQDILVVGDSQVFGLGVDDDATFSARLASSAGRPVLNAGVPTYGPREYLATAREVLATRKVATVVVALNFVNDPFELDRPNSTRHAVWDGWAVRKETAPAEVLEFPGRRWLFARSHAVYALRRWLHERGSASAPEAVDVGVDPTLDLGTPSEGGLHDLVLASKTADRQVADREAEATRELLAASRRAASLDSEIASKRDDLDSLVTQASKYRFDYFQNEVARSRPGDIVNDNSSEEGRSVVVTAAMIREAARTRDKLLADLLKAEEKQAGERPAHAILASQETLVAEQQRLRQQIATGVAPILRPPSQFRGYLEEFKALCDQHGAELVVVALPIDVQVDPREWAKYGVTDAPDMRESLVLLADLLADARDLGLRGLDATTSLRAAEPGAFLDHDIHMTARGHAALAEALTATLAAPAPAPVQGPRPGLPRGRSFVPTAGEWASAAALPVTGDIDTGCTLQTQREWVRLQCPSRSRYDNYRHLMLGPGVTPATMVLTANDTLAVVTPMTIGQPFAVRVMSKGKSKRGGSRGSFELTLTAVAGPDDLPRYSATVTEAAFKLDDGFRSLDLDRLRDLFTPIQSLCDCHRERHQEHVCDAAAEPPQTDTAACPLACSSLWADQRLIPACLAAYSKCDERLACAQSDPLFPITCPEGQIHAFANNACFVVCDAEHPCASGTCTPWHGGSVCVVD